MKETEEVQDEPSPPPAQESQPSSPAVPPVVSGTPVIVLISAYSQVKSNEAINFIWAVDEIKGKTATHTAVHWGRESRSGTLGLLVKPSEAGYPNATEEYANGTFTLSNIFQAEITFSEPGTYYYRAHAIIGGKNYWTEEYALKVE